MFSSEYPMKDKFFTPIFTMFEKMSFCYVRLRKNKRSTVSVSIFLVHFRFFLAALSLSAWFNIFLRRRIDFGVTSQYSSSFKNWSASSKDIFLVFCIVTVCSLCAE